MTAQSWRALRRQLVRLAGHEAERARELLDSIAAGRRSERSSAGRGDLAWKTDGVVVTTWSRPRVVEPLPASQSARRGSPCSRERVPEPVWDAVWAHLDQQDLLTGVERTCREWRRQSAKLGLGWRDTSFGGEKLTALRLVVLGRRLAHVRGSVALEAPSEDAKVYYERHLGWCTGARLHGHYAEVAAAARRVAAGNYAVAERRYRGRGDQDDGDGKSENATGFSAADPDDDESPPHFLTSLAVVVGYRSNTEMPCAVVDFLGLPGLGNVELHGRLPEISKADGDIDGVDGEPPLGRLHTVSLNCYYAALPATWIERAGRMHATLHTLALTEQSPGFGPRPPPARHIASLQGLRLLASLTLGIRVSQQSFEPTLAALAALRCLTLGSNFACDPPEDHAAAPRAWSLRSVLQLETLRAEYRLIHFDWVLPPRVTTLLVGYRHEFFDHASERAIAVAAAEAAGGKGHEFAPDDVADYYHNQFDRRVGGGYSGGGVFSSVRRLESYVRRDRLTNIPEALATVPHTQVRRRVAEAN